MERQQNLFEGRRLREAGKTQVVMNTDVGWRIKVNVLADDFLQYKRGSLNDHFTGEDLRLYCQSRNLTAHNREPPGEPHHPNAWSAAIGAILRGWQKAGYISKAGSTEARDPKAHARLIRVYRIRS